MAMNFEISFQRTQRNARPECSGQRVARLYLVCWWRVVFFQRQIALRFQADFHRFRCGNGSPLQGEGFLWVSDVRRNCVSEIRFSYCKCTGLGLATCVEIWDRVLKERWFIFSKTKPRGGFSKIAISTYFCNSLKPYSQVESQVSRQVAASGSGVTFTS